MDINSRDGFEKEVLEKYDAEVYDAFSEAFSYLQVASIIEKKVSSERAHNSSCQSGTSARKIVLSQLGRLGMSIA